MILLDAFALIAFLRGEPAAPEVRQLLSSERVALLAPNLAEAADRLTRVHTVPADRVREAVETLTVSAQFELRGVTIADAWRAAQLRQRHYHRVDCAVSLADCFLLAGASGEDSVATADPAALRVAQAEGIRRIALPDSRGHRHGDR